MPSVKLTQRFVDGLGPSDKLTLYFDQALKGFGVYTTKGAKTYFIQARVNGKEKKRTIGKASLMKLDKARTEAINILAQMANGIDPEAEKRHAEITALTLGETYKRYKESRKLKDSSISRYDDLLNNYVAEWKDRAIGEISKEMIADKHRSIGAKHGENAANNLMRLIRALYNFAYYLAEEKIPSNPVVRLSQTRQWYKVERRHTFLKPHELKPWHDAASRITSPVTRDYLFLILFTGLREKEGLTLRWETVDMLDRSFTIHETKNGKPHTLPMSNFLFDLFERLKTIRTNDFVFPGRGKSGHLADSIRQLQFITTQTQYAFNGVTTKAEFEKKLAQNHDYIVVPGIKFCLHDLRRTFITIAESLDIPYAALKRLLNHSDGNDVTGGYLQITTDRLREPMERISSKLIELMGIQPIAEQTE